MKGTCTIQIHCSRHKIPALHQADLHLINTMGKCFRGRCSKLTLTYCLFLVLLKAATKFSSVYATNEGKQRAFASQDFLFFLWFASRKISYIFWTTHCQLLSPPTESVSLNMSSSSTIRESKNPQTLFKNMKNIFRTQIKIVLLPIQMQNLLKEHEVIWQY